VLFRFCGSSSDSEFFSLEKVLLTRSSGLGGDLYGENKGASKGDRSKKAIESESETATNRAFSEHEELTHELKTTKINRQTTKQDFTSFNIYKCQEFAVFCQKIYHIRLFLLNYHCLFSTRRLSLLSNQTTGYGNTKKETAHLPILTGLRLVFEQKIFS